ncbi:sorbitol dehydrogenase [Aplysia californica]|uniref:Sorbitol dehydrogenase n=1 Tax=Aplysia californica TaxID=6500 RepID=A0ABM0JGI1_APLCA|nr:sorbitol dehydrogenase [Aplysia californica]XP_005093173.1 sorbitol dehydrogenase [Aplysia californica]XP_005093174.1 sorbitol dehydrogenase [Aplysia californica]
METNTAVRLHGVNDLRVEELEVPTVGPGDVLVKPALVGICGSDLHFLHTGAIGSYILRKPIVLGHEISAVVCQLGEGVEGLKVGDHVSVDPMRPCLDCFYCARKRYNLCTRQHIAGIPHTDGAFARFMVTPASSCFKLPDGCSLEEGAFMEPLSISVWGFRRCPVIPGEKVVVIGAGTIGLLAAQAAKAYGASKVMVVDVVQSRLDLATQLGVDLTLKIDPKAETSQNAEAIKAALGSEADQCVECSGAPGAVDTAILSCRRAGRLLMLGLGEMKMDVNLGLAALNEVDVIGAICNNGVFPECVELVSSGKVKVTPLISKKMPLRQVKEALKVLEQDSRDCIKILIECQK